MKKSFITLCILSTLPTYGWATNTQLTLSSGVFYSEGQSSTTNSANATMIALPFSASARIQKWRLGLSTAVLESKFNGTTASGVGDTTLSLGYEILSQPWITLKGKYKFPTGDANQGLSTGKEDLSLQVDLFHALTTRSSVFTTLGYKLVGKVTGQSMQNSAYASIGAGYIPTRGLSTGLSLDYRQATYTTLDDQLGASLFLSQKLNQKWSLSVFGGYDNTNTLSTGMTFSYRL